MKPVNLARLIGKERPVWGGHSCNEEYVGQAAIEPRHYLLMRFSIEVSRAMESQGQIDLIQNQEG